MNNPPLFCSKKKYLNSSTISSRNITKIVQYYNIARNTQWTNDKYDINVTPHGSYHPSRLCPPHQRHLHHYLLKGLYLEVPLRALLADF